MYTPAPGYKWNAVLVILRAGDEILLLKRKKQPNQDLFVPPGGKVEPYERPRDAAARECEEETGFRPPVLHFLGVISESSPTQYNWSTFVYWADSERFAPPPLDEGELAWIRIAEASPIPAPVTAQPLT
ncbi:MAG TPA: NUDIX hydrolase, partial [Cytophagales bacterium]|nr:NUDIX hydrolase [Cytophagales bacterium]